VQAGGEVSAGGNVQAGGEILAGVLAGHGAGAGVSQVYEPGLDKNGMSTFPQPCSVTDLAESSLGQAGHRASCLEVECS